MYTERFRILFVCHANLCRSPLAERLARRAFDDAFGPAAAASVAVSSAGTRAYPGSPMHPGSAEVLGECGIESGGFVTRTVDVGVLADADLVLTAAREQRAACVTLAPGAVRRTFTLRQFARLAVAVPAALPGTVPQRLHGLVDGINAVRHTVPAVPGDEDDLPDPVNQPIEAFRVCAEDVWRSLSTVVGVIAAA
ncbi:arsenate-mycothiol transferase ArsC [Jidongwangia harbinensis]|uniref:arsenate-mycothiol transferase ArsC n=1 Tax=Jidongwangia harbinensis TaxID=2878561 RepID=UPI001CD96181|nr:low molecular weight phosphatase family protein [Jidongwangia harbinensis]MCA2213279.1 low molecular weight phosphatase family protein [Jidongwangia harbinensis]